jgi:radical SAM superfamily enzyme YgiQ (UPF0313 family)
MSAPATVIGLAQFTRGLNLTRQRFNNRKTRGGSVAIGARQRPAEAADWQIFPYAAGLLQAYAQRHAATRDRATFLPILHAPVSVEAAADALAAADLVAFSCYVWNIERSLAVARLVKQRRPETIVVAGGPQVPDHADAFLRDNPAIDLACHGEGERTFARVVDAAASRAWHGIDGVSFIEDGRFHHRPPAPRLKELDQVPSPYLEGVFDPIMAADPTRKWVMLWETNRGCPFACTFCDWGSAVASKVYQFDRARLEAELDWFADREGEFIFCCDANFGILPRDVELAQAAAAVKARRGFPRTLSVQNTKNATERSYQVQRTLADAGMNAGVTLSLQSTDAHTLKSVKRDNISLASFEELQRRYTRDGIPTYTDIILGLPGESYDSFANGVATIVERGQHTRTHFYNCSLLPNAEMSQPAYRAEFGIQTVRQAMIDMHGVIEPAEGDVTEYLEIAVATSAMPAADWVRTKVYAWAVDLLLYDRLLYLPLVVLYADRKIGVRAQVEALAAAPADKFPVVASVFNALAAHARSIQNGGPEYLPSAEWLGIYWPADQHALITLATTFKTDAFYEEAEAILSSLVADAEGRAALHDAMELNRHLLRLPFEVNDATLDLEHDVWRFAADAAAGRPATLERRPVRCTIRRTKPIWVAWEDWYEHVIFCQNQKATYLYPVEIEAVASTAGVA